MNMAGELTEDKVYCLEETKTYSYILKVKDFSNEVLHVPSKPVRLEKTGYMPFSLYLYANGKSTEQQGYVSVVFEIEKYYLSSSSEYFEFICTLCVIDVSENERFSQSCGFVYPRDTEMMSHDVHQFALERFLKRNTLFTDRPDLLPGDCLSLQIDAVIRFKFSQPSSQNYVRTSLSYCFMREICGSEKYFYFDLNSHLAKRLGNVSDFFKKMLETPMAEKMTQLMNIPVDDFLVFRDVCAILMGDDEISLKSVTDICHLYRVAHFYDISPVIDSCRNMLTSILRIKNYPFTVKQIKENIEKLLNFVDIYEEDRLKENIQSFLKFNPEESDEERSTESKLHNNQSDTEWELHPYASEKSFVFRKIKPEIEIKPETDFYDFYQ